MESIRVRRRDGAIRASSDPAVEPANGEPMAAARWGSGETRRSRPTKKGGLVSRQSKASGLSPAARRSPAEASTSASMTWAGMPLRVALSRASAAIAPSRSTRLSRKPGRRTAQARPTTPGPEPSRRPPRPARGEPMGKEESRRCPPGAPPWRLIQLQAPPEHRVGLPHHGARNSWASPHRSRAVGPGRHGPSAR